FSLNIENKGEGNGIRFTTLPNEGVFAPYTLPVNQWTHIACTIEGTESAIFINGIWQASASHDVSAENNSELLLFAKNNDGDYFPGMLDEVQFWHSVRSEEQILNDMLRPNMDPWGEGDMYSYWQFDFAYDDGGILYTFDSRQKGNATFYNGPLSVTSDLGTPMPPVERITATDGLFEDRVVVQWSRVPNVNLLYEIFRDGELLSVASSEDSVYIDMTGIRGVEYNYCVKVLSPEGLLSGERCAIGKTIVFAPEPFSASYDDFSSGVELHWGRKSNVAISYMIYRDGNILVETASNINRYFDTTATPGVEHFYAIIARDSTDRYSDFVNAAGKRAYVLPPTNFSATDGTYPDRVKLTWRNPAQPIFDHWLMRDGNVLQAHVPAGDTMFIDTTAQPGVTHTYCMFSSDGAHESKSVCDNGGIGILPAPANVVASDSLFDDMITVTWEDTSNLEDKFIIARSDGKRDTLAANTTSFTDMLATPGTEYTFCVTAVSANGGESQPVCDNGTRAIVLAPDTLIASDSIFENRTVLAWSSKSTKVVLFKIFRDGKQIATRSSGTRTYEDFDGVANKKYDYAISAMDARGNESRRIHATGSRALRGPSNLLVTKNAFEDKIVLTWQDNSGFETGYRIRRSFVDGIYEIAELEPNRTSFTDSSYGNISGVEYHYYVDAYNRDPDDHSDERVSFGYSEADSGIGNWRLRSPGNVQASDGLYEDKIVISWEDSSQVESGYFIYRNGDTLPYATVGANSTSFTDVSPLFGQQIAYEVAAYRNYELNISGKISDVGSTILFPPASINVSNNYSNKVTVSVIDGSKAPNHKVQVFRDGAMLAEGTSSLYITDSTSPNPGTQTYTAKTVAEDGVTTSTEISATGGIGPIETITNLLTATTPVSNGQFGYSVAIDGDRAIIGHVGSKMVSFFQNIGGVWKHLQTVTSHTTVPTYGQAVTISGNIAVVGAPDADAIFIYKQNTSNNIWDEVNYFPYNRTGIKFGYSVSLDGDILAVGVPYDNYYTTEGGGVGLYYIDVSNGNLYLRTYYAANGSSRWGSSVSVDSYAYYLGTTPYHVYAIGGPGIGQTSGFVYIIFNEVVSSLKADNNTAEGNETHPIKIDQTKFTKGNTSSMMQTTAGDMLYGVYGFAPGDRFGSSVAVKGTRVVVGAPAEWEPGKVFFYKYTGSDYTNDATVAGYTDMGNKFGRSISLISDKLLVGGGNYDSQTIATLYNWAEPTGGASNPTITDSLVFIGGSSANAGWFGNSVGLTSSGVIIGVPNESSTQSNAGGAYMFNWNSVNANVAEVVSFKASDGTYRDHVQLDWTSSGAAPTGFHLYRDTTLLATMSGTDVTYSDMEIAPGKTSKYSIAAFNSTYGESRRVSDYGWRPADGTISGRVANGTGTGVESVKVCIEPLPLKSLHFDGNRGVIDFGAPADLNFRGTITLEAWVRPTSLQSSQQNILSHGDFSTGEYTNLMLLNGFYSLVSVSNGTNVVTAYPIPGDDLNTWVHLATVYDGTSWTLYRNGVYVNQTVSTAGPAVTTDSWNIGGRLKQQSAFYSGEIDEVRIWNAARTQFEIQDAMSKKLTGKETGLLAYWAFDEGAGNIITDLTGKSHYGTTNGGVFWSADVPDLNVCSLTDQQGNYSIGGINYGSSTTFRVIPQKEDSKFLPAFKGITLSTGNPVQNEVTFTDNTSYTITGYVQYAGTNCFAQNIQIFVDGTARGVTDRSGGYRVSVPRGEHTIEAKLDDHTFSPASYQVVVAGDVAGKNFMDTKTRRITGKVSGGCNKAIGDVELTFRSESECFITTLNLTSPTNYNIILSPQKYFVQVTNVNNVQAPLDRAAILEYFTNIGARAVDLTSADTTLDFIYHAPIKVQITGLTGDTCEPLRARILQQGPAPINLRILVTEDYGSAGVCNVDTATVTIIDEINDVEDEPVTIGVKNGIGLYTTYANTPNTAPGRYDASGFNRSYQKAITAIAEVIGQRPVIATQWAIVKGRKQRQGSRFVTGFSTPVPLYVIHDPPGDGSYAYVEKGYSFCKKIDPLEVHHKNGGGLGVDVKLGFKFQNGVGFGVFLATETFFRAVLKLDITAGNQVDREGATTICGTFADQYSSSPGENFVGADADIFIGYGENYIFALTDVVDVQNCQIVLPPPAVGFDRTGFSTTFAFTRGHIKNSVIPSLELLKQDAIRRRDSGGKDSVAFFQSFINAWRDMLAWDSTQMATAALTVNRSFSAGADYQYSFQADTTVAYMEKKTIWLDQSLSAGLGFGTSGNESEIVGQQLTQHEWLDELTDTSGTTTRSFGYFLSDNDDGDNFTVDVMKASNELSPVFKVKAGASSCPYEPWKDNTGKPTMTRRDLPEISLTPAAQVGVQPDQPAIFTLNLTNKSETEETRSYVLSIVDSSNRGGAIVTANGAPIYAGVPLTVPYNQTRYLTLTVERGPIFYDYSKLLLRVGPECESDREDVSKTISLDVRFAAPCTDISLFEPASGWLVNQADSSSTHSKLNITMKDFLVLFNGKDSIIEIGAQYRRVGDVSWLPIGSLKASSLQEGKSASIQWDYSGIAKDGEYEIRAYSKCASGNGYSSVIRGLIDRTSLEVFGAPQPADSVLTLGEEISISFSEKIDRNSITPVSILMRKEVGGLPADTIAVGAVTNGNTIIITPLASAVALEGQQFTVLVKGIKDAQGNAMQGSKEWKFTVRRNGFIWSQSHISKDVPYHSSAQFVARLSNGSSQDAHYVITEKPSWLQVASDTGTIRQASVGEIVFTIPDTLRINANYTGMVSVIDPNIGVSDFTVSVNVSCELPDWVAPSNKYEYSMNIIDSLLIGSIPSSDTNDIVAAIIGGEVRGVANVKFVPSVGYRIFMTVYSNNPRGERVKFRVWDASECRLYNSTFETFRFMKDTIIGDPYRPEPLTAIDAAAYDVLPISIKPGWNWFSTNVRAQDMTTTGILSDIPLSQGDIVKSIDEFAVNDGNEWSGSLVELENTQSYMLKVKESGTLAIEGNFVDSTFRIPIRTGWNWISYLPKRSLFIDDAFSNYGLAVHDTDFIKAQVSFAKYVTAGAAKKWIGSLETMEPGKGYKLYAKRLPSDTSFSYFPSGTLSGMNQFAGDMQYGEVKQRQIATTNIGLTDWVVNPHAFESNMTMTSILKIQNKEISYDSVFVGAFAGDECRGFVKATYNRRYDRWYAFLMIYSNMVEEDNIKLRVYDTRRGEIWEMPDSIVFKVDGVLGTMGSPQSINATKLYVRLGVGVEDEVPQVYQLFSNYPNPFNPETRIKYALPERSHVQIKVFNTLGQLVTTLVDNEESAGYRVVPFDGTGYASGLYFFRLEAVSLENPEHSFIEVKKMLLVK
ncbi:MAG: T9SS type A sorting domain-containing protein, partial [Bacteroidetes bacterium]